MARRQVVEVECSRCDRKELRDMTQPLSPIAINGPPPDPPKALIVRLGDGTKIDFDDLCEPCMSAVKGHLESIGKKIVGLSPERKKKDDTETPSSKKKA